MRKHIGGAVATGLGALALVAAGCAGTSTSSSGSAAPQNAVKVSAPAKTGYHNMSTLTESVKVQVQKGLNGQGNGETVTSGYCFSTGANTAACHITATEGDKANFEIQISTDGSTWVSH